MDTKSLKTEDNLESVSRLYNLEPIGIGTPYTECLTSYVTRLAEAHNVTLGTLIGKEITPILNKHYLNKVATRGGGGIYKSASSINGVKSAAMEMLKSLEQLTLRDDLRFLTLTKWSEILPTRGLLRPKKAWCPQCIDEWNLHKKPIYEPLIWFIKEVEICNIHETRLQTYCPNCTKEIPTLSRNSRVGFCSHCSHWLGQSKVDNSSQVETSTWNYWKVTNIGQLLELMPSNELIPGRERLKLVLNQVLEVASVKEILELSNIPRSSFNSWMDEDKLPSLPNLLIIIYCLGISQKQFLTDELNTLKFNLRPFPYSKGHLVPNRFSDRYIREQLLYYADNVVTPPPSVKEIASIIGCDRRLLYKKAPELCKVVSKKYIDFIQNCSLDRIEFVKKQVVNAVNILSNQGIYPSRRKVESYTKMPGTIKAESIRQVWRQEKEKLNQEGKI